MDYTDALAFLSSNFDAVVNTFRKSGAIQSSVVKAGAYQSGVVFVAIGNSAKLKNLARDPRCTVTIVSPHWNRWCAVEGKVVIRDWDNTDHEALRIELRETFVACGGDHDDWDEYDRVMREDRRAIVVVQPDHIYGQGV